MGAMGKPEGITLDCEGTNAKLRDVYSHFSSLQSPTHQTYLSKPALQLANKLCPDKTEDSVEGKKVSVTNDETDGSSDPCYRLNSNKSVKFPDFESACPKLIPMPQLPEKQRVRAEVLYLVEALWWRRLCGEARQTAERRVQEIRSDVWRRPLVYSYRI